MAMRHVVFGILFFALLLAVTKTSLELKTLAAFALVLLFIMGYSNIQTTSTEERYRKS